MSLAQDLVRDMVAQGHSMAEIGRYLGRDSSMISQIASGKRGENYGASMTGYLRELSTKFADAATTASTEPLEVVKPPRRLDAAGRVAGTRRKITHGGAHSGVSAVKKQATKNGAKSLGPQVGAAADEGRRGALTITCGPNAVIAKSSRKSVGDAEDQDVDVDVPDLDELIELIMEHEGNVTEAVIDYLTNHDRAGEGLQPSDLLGIEFRSWTE